MARSSEHKICSPSPEMVTFPYEWKILKWDDFPQTNKQNPFWIFYLKKTFKLALF